MRNQNKFYDCDTPPVRGKHFRIPLGRAAALRLKIKRPGNKGPAVRELVADIVPRKGRARIGYYHGFILDTGALSKGGLFITRDKKTRELRDFVRDLAKNIPDPRGEGLLYLSRIEILPPYRGKRYGIKTTKAVARFCRRAFKVAACFMEPFPLQHEKRYDRKTAGTFTKDRSRLIAYYQNNLPFNRLSPSSKYYYFQIDRLT